MPSFEDAWELYGRVGGKIPGEKAWNKLSFIEHKLIMAHLPERLKTDKLWLKGIGKPHFSTFCNNQRWTDEYEKLFQLTG